MTNHARYLWLFALSCLMAGAAVAALNYCINPYGIFGAGCAASLNAKKPAAADRVGVMKPFLADRAAATTVIGGNSRPEMGLDPSSPCWREEHRPVFNAGVPGASISMQALHVMHAAKTDGRHILLGVDFLDFIERANEAPSEVTSASTPQRSAEEMRLAIPGLFEADHAFILQRSKDTAKALLSLSALTDSVYTAASQRNPYASTREPNGFNPARDYLAIIRSEGQQVLFAQKNVELKQRLQPAYRLEPLDGSNTSGFVAVRRLAAWSRAQRISLTLFINPYHKDYLQAIADSGKWDLFEDWKRALSSLADSEQIPLWDFTGINSYTSETMPMAGDRRSMLDWFWEPAHYRSELGEIMLSNMLDSDCGQTHSTRRPFGVRLEPPMLQAHMARVRGGISLPD